MFIYEEKEVTRIESKIKAVRCDKCEKLIEGADTGYHKYVMFNGHPSPGFMDDWSVTFHLCNECADDLVEKYLASYGEW